MTTTVTLIRNRDGDIDAHAAGCADLKKTSKYDRFEQAHVWSIEAETRDDVTFEVWGASGVASDDCPAPWDSAEYRQFTLDNYSGQVRFPACLKTLPKGGAS